MRKLLTSFREFYCPRSLISPDQDHDNHLADVCRGPVVEAAHDGEADGEAGGPAQEDDHLGGRGVVPVLAVQDRGGHREEPGRCTYLFYNTNNSLC